MNTCRYCNLPLSEDEAVSTRSYWNHDLFQCHAACKLPGEQAEALECQTIDADCNDCRHFRRGEVVKRELSCMTNGKPATRIVNMGIIDGRCAMYGKPTQAFPNKWTGRECFVHRRA